MGDIEQEIFSEINEYRKSVGLCQLKWNDSFRLFAEDVVNNEFQFNDEQNSSDSVIFHVKSFCSHHGKRDPKTMINSWLGSPENREVLLSPGNHGASFYVEKSPKDSEDHRRKYVVVFVSLIYR